MGGQAASLRQRWVLLGIILLAFLLRVYSLGRGELWFDEALSAVIAAKGWAGILQHTLNAPFEHPPLYYLSLHAWTRAIGTTEFALRFFSLFWGILLVPLLYRFMASWGGQPFGLLVALVCALSAVHIDHSQNARMYSILPVLGILLLICFFRGLETWRFRWGFGFLAVSVLGIAVHYYFFLMLLVPLAFLLLGGKRYRRQVVLLFLVLVICVLLVATWFGFSPGFRQALQQVVIGEGGGVSSLGQRIMHTAGRVFSEPPVAGNVALGVLAVLGAVLWPLPPAPHTHPVSQVGSRRFVLVWLLVPWLVALLIPYWLQDRHLAYLLPAMYALVAGGLLVLRGRSKALFLAGLFLMGATTGYWLYRQDAEPEFEFEFGKIMTYIEDRALPDDLLIMNQPAFWPFEEYYAQGDLATTYVPAYSTLPDEALDSKMRPLVSQRSRVWLGPIGAWAEDPESRVERWLVSHAYQAYKEWFTGGGSAALYFTTNALEPLAIEPAVAWEDGVLLVTAHSSSLMVTAGDAVRLAFGWQTAEALESSHLVSLYLVDDDGQVWATRQSEPCGGWCPTDTWQPATLVQDQHALLIPEGTPPGSYRLQVALYAPDEGRDLVAAGSGQRVDLGPVQVMEPGPAEAGPGPVVQYPLAVGFGNEIDLLGFDLASAEVPAGGTIALDLYWQVQNRPSDDYELLLELVMPNGEVLANWRRPLVADTVPTSVWLAGQYLRGPHQISLPAQVAPGKYALRLEVLDPQCKPLPSSDSDHRKGVARLLPWQAHQTEDGLVLEGLVVTELPDRSHNFELPTMANSLHYRLGQRVDLLGYDLDTASAAPGGQIELTLYWQALGATVKPYKVFTHLGDDGLSPPVAQHDDLPGEGCCPPNTWVAGEVVVDRHLVPLAADLDPDTYLLTAGMYDELTGLRLSVFDAQGNEVAGDRIPITEVVIHPRSKPAPAPILPEMDFRIYLPLVEANQ